MCQSLLKCDIFLRNVFLKKNFYSSEVAKLTRTNAKELSLKMKERQICRKKMECKSHLQIASWTWQGQRKGKKSSRSETNESRSLFSSKEISHQEEASFIQNHFEGVTRQTAVFSHDKDQCLTVI